MKLILLVNVGNNLLMRGRQRIMLGMEGGGKNKRAALPGQGDAQPRGACGQRRAENRSHAAGRARRADKG